LNLIDAAVNGVPIQVNRKDAGTLTKVGPLVLDIMNYKPKGRKRLERRGNRCGSNSKPLS
jgi:hypothetical protein